MGMSGMAMPEKNFNLSVGGGMYILGSFHALGESHGQLINGKHLRSGMLIIQR